CRPARSVAGVALFLPRVSVHVVAIGLPEAGLVAVEQVKAAHPFSALPEVQMRHEQPHRAAMLGRQRLAVVAERQPRLAAGHVRDRQVGGVPAVAEGQHVLRVGAYLFEQGLDRHCLPAGVQLGPAGDTVDVSGHLLDRQLLQLGPGPRLLLFAAAPDRERPVLFFRVRRRTSRQYGEVLGHVLTWRYPSTFGFTALAVESPRHRTHVVTRSRPARSRNAMSYGVAGPAMLGCMRSCLAEQLGVVPGDDPGWLDRVAEPLASRAGDVLGRRIAGCYRLGEDRRDPAADFEHGSRVF